MSTVVRQSAVHSQCDLGECGDEDEEKERGGSVRECFRTI
jgi:hypothetical protein